MKYLKYLFMLIMLFSIDVYADNYSVDFNKKGKFPEPVAGSCSNEPGNRRVYKT